MDVGVLTLFVLVLQAIIYGFMLWQMKKSTDASTVSAIAAKESAEAATSAVSLAERNAKLTARAVVLIDTVRFNTEGIQLNSTILFTLKNFGRAIAYRVKFSGVIGGVGQLPIEETPSNTIAPQGNSSWMSKSISAFLLPPEIRIGQINSRLVELNYKIDVTYEDAFGPHAYHCEGKYEPALKEFIITSSTSD
jgi:uncharacterized protein (UPF0333 family)